MKDEKEKKIQEAKETPIADGDTRPDDQERAGRAKEYLKEKKKSGTKLTKERAADINSLEDFKDAN